MHNFPAVLNIIDVKQFENFTHLYLKLLLSDPADNIRVTAISCLPVISKLIGFEETRNYLKVPVIKLFDKT